VAQTARPRAPTSQQAAFNKPFGPVADFSDTLFKIPQAYEIKVTSEVIFARFLGSHGGEMMSSGVGYDAV
jgi:hypothetical protein